jgi:hypothetical protein
MARHCSDSPATLHAMDDERRRAMTNVVGARGAGGLNSISGVRVVVGAMAPARARLPPNGVSGAVPM